MDQEDYTIVLHGDLDASSSILLDEALEKAVHKSYRNILVSFRGLSYISAAGLGVFISHIKSIQEQDKVLILFEMDEKIRNVFAVTGLDEFIPIVSSACEAQQLCRQRTCKH